VAFIGTSVRGSRSGPTAWQATAVVDGAVEAWRVHDTGLVVAPSRFRRLPGAVRHHQGQGDPWPVTVRLVVQGDELVVTALELEVGRWPVAEVSARVVADGPPVSFVLDVPGGSHLLAAAPGAALDGLLASVAG
jgi:hypothetical protein